MGRKKERVNEGLGGGQGGVVSTVIRVNAHTLTLSHTKTHNHTLSLSFSLSHTHTHAHDAQRGGGTYSRNRFESRV